MAHYKGAASEAGRAMHLQKKREKALEDLELRKKKIEEELKLHRIESKFATHYDAVEAQLKSSTIGLVTLDEMKAKQEDVVKERERQMAKRQLEKDLQRQQEIEAKNAEKRRQKQQIASLSFNPYDEEDEEEDEKEQEDEKEEKQEEAAHEENAHDKKKDVEVKKEIKEEGEGPEKDDSDSDDFFTDELLLDDDASSCPKKKRKLGKNPDVDTSFLPDRDREEEENRLREELRQEWVKKQEKLKSEEIDITFSYWDGSGHRRSVRMKKGNSIHQFLQRCLEMLRKEFNELRTVSADQLVYVKEDLIIPHHYTFYDFIVTKARGKSGPLFSFDVHEDVRLVSDATVEKDESHAGKVLLRGWYERNKHIFPASRWEPYDPERTYEKYSISDKCNK